MKYILTAILALSLSPFVMAQSRPPQITAQEQSKLLAIKIKYQKQQAKLAVKTQALQNEYQVLQLAGQRLLTAEQMEIASAVPHVDGQDWTVDLDTLGVRPVPKPQPPVAQAPPQPQPTPEK